MSDQGPNVGLVLVGIFVILFGACITLVGGGCTLLLLTMGSGGVGGGGVGSEFAMFLLLSLAVLGVGCLILWGGYKVVKAGYNNDVPRA
ncbi:MAG TPA: hypothetical protein VIT38_14390 [Allosphingosinicella sp.]